MEEKGAGEGLEVRGGVGDTGERQADEGGACSLGTRRVRNPTTISKKVKVRQRKDTRVGLADGSQTPGQRGGEGAGWSGAARAGRAGAGPEGAWSRPPLARTFIPAGPWARETPSAACPLSHLHLATPGAAGAGQRTVVAALSPLGSGEAPLGPAGAPVPSGVRLGQGPAARCPPFPEHMPHTWGMQTGARKGGREGRRRDEEAALGSQGTGRRASVRLEHAPVAQVFTPKPGRPVRRARLCPVRRKRHQEVASATQGASLGPGLSLREARRGGASGGGEKGKKVSGDAGPAASRK